MPAGGEIVVKHLVREGVRHVFTVPGESFISILDAMREETALRPILTRNESAAAMMAEATGHVTGRPGVALVTRGPGAANAWHGVYIASQSHAPMLLLVALAQSDAVCPTFQDIDAVAAFSGIAKWCAVVPDAGVLAGMLARAFEKMLSGVPGPVVLGIPEDVLLASTNIVSSNHEPPAGEMVSPLEAAHIRLALAHAKKPLVVVGGSPWSGEAKHTIENFASRFNVPVVTSFRRQDYIDNRHACYAGHAGLNMDKSLTEAFARSDCVLMIGAPLDGVGTQGLPLVPRGTSGGKVIQFSLSRSPLDAAYAGTRVIRVSLERATAALAKLEPRGKIPWQAWTEDVHNAYLQSLVPKPTPGAVQLEQVIAELSRALPDDAIVCNGAGNYAAFLHRYFQYKSYPSQVAPQSGSMGYGLPAAIAAKLAYPERTVIAVAGDGCFQMSGQELATLAQFDIPVVVIVINNSSLGTIRLHQERRYPGRVTATTLINPDFVSLAGSYGIAGERIEATAAFAPALRSAIAANAPAVLEVITDIEAIAPETTLAQLATVAKSNGS